MSLATDHRAAGRPDDFRRMSVVARRGLLDDLIEQLSPYEWRYLQNRLAPKRFQFDIFGSLPPELAAHIATCLTPLDVVSSRRVSKRWQGLLHSVEICKEVCVSHWPRASVTSVSDWTRYLEQKSSLDHALASGRPWSKATYDDGPLGDKANYSTQQLCGAHFAWRCKDPTTGYRQHIAILSFDTGMISRFVPTSVFMLIQPKLSELLVGCLTSEG